MPYDNLTKLSYGPLLPVVPASCDPNAQGDGAGVAELSRRLTALIAKPLAGISQVDPIIEREGLADKFSIPGDPAFPPVVILDRSEDGIVFWHEMNLVPVRETAAAATTYCGRRGRRAVWEGSAEQCGDPNAMPIKINHQQVVVVSSRVISSYICAGPAGRGT